MASRVSKPILCRVFSYSVPGFPRPTIRKDMVANIGYTPVGRGILPLVVLYSADASRDTPVGR